MGKLFFILPLFLFCNFRITAQNDSLNGFDEIEVLAEAKSQNFYSNEYTAFLTRKKREFIKKKYKLSEAVLENFNYNNKASSSSQPNIDFEAGDLSTWSVISGTNTNSLEMLDNTFGNSVGTATVVNGGVDPVVGIPLSSPLGGNWVAQINYTVPNGTQTKIRNKISVTESNNLLKFVYAAVLQSAFHPCESQPFFAVILKDTNGKLLFKYIVQANDTLYPIPCLGHNQPSLLLNLQSSVFYSNWSMRCVDLTPYIGKDVFLEVIGGGCAAVAHYGYGYFDAKLETCPDYGHPNILSINNQTVDFNLNYIEYNNPVCATTMTLVAPGWPSFYNWNGSPGSGIFSSSLQAIITSSNGLHTLTMGNTTVCPITKSLMLRPNAREEINITVYNPWCVNTTQTVYLSGARSYTVSDGTSLPTILYPGSYALITPSVSGLHSITVTATSSAGCVFTKMFTFNVYGTPTLAISGYSSYCIGSPVTLYASGSNAYHWLSGTGANTVSATGASITAILPVNSITLTGTDISGCKSSLNYTLDYSYPISTINTNFTSTNICIGNAANLIVSGLNLAIPAGIFSLSSGLNTSTINSSTSLSLSPNISTIYTLSASNYCGLVTKTIAINVSSLTPSLNYTVLPPFCNDSYSINVSGANSYGLIGSVSCYSYIVNNNMIVVNNPYGPLTISGTFSNSACFSTITHTPFPIPFTLSVTPTTPICSNSVASFSFTGGNGIYSITPLPFFGPPIAASYTVGSTFTVIPPPNLFYYNVKSYNNSGCLEDGTYYMPVSVGTPTINSSINGKVTDTYTICAGQVATIVLSGANTYSWDFGSNSYVISVTPTTSTIYTVQGNTGCGSTSKTIAIHPIASPPANVTITPSSYSPCINSLISVIASGATSYTWLSNNSSTSPSINAWVSNSTSYGCKYTDTNGCIATSSFCPIIPITANLNIIGVDTICRPANPTYTALGGSNYSWTVSSYLGSNTSSSSIYTLNPPANNPNTIIYNFTLTGLSANNCTGIKTYSIITYGKPVIQIKPHITKCPGLEDTLFVSNPWLFAPNSLTWSTGSISNSIVVQPSSTVIYTVQSQINSFGCTSQATTQTSAVFALNPPTFFASAYSVCEGEDNITLTVTNTSIAGLYFSGLKDNYFRPSVPGIFPIYCYYIDANGCYNQSSTQSITVLPKPNVSLNVQSTSFCLNDGVLFTGTPIGGVFIGASGTGNTYTPAFTTTSTVVYSYTNSSGCTNYDQKCFYISSCLNLQKQGLLENVRVYPNPFDSELHIDNDSHEKILLTLTDIKGIVLETKSIYSGQNIISESLPKGMYFITLTSMNGRSVFKLIKN